MAYTKIGFLLLLTIGASACGRGGDEYFIPYEHPASPDGRTGAVLVGSNALDPELRSVSPQVKPTRSAPKPSTTDAHQHHRH